MNRVVAILVVSSGLIQAAPHIEKHTVFDGGAYTHYRIPGLVVTDKGTLLAYCEARKTDAGDWGQIDILFRRSTDRGRSWSKAAEVVQIGKNFEKNPVAAKQKLGKPGEVTANNPVAIVDRGIVHFLYCVEYMRCFYTRSEDDGVTWAAPVEITPAFEGFRKDYNWKVLATGPGHGIRLSKSGRLVVPVWLSTGEGGHAHRPSAIATIYSDDRGKTWQAGQFVVKHPDLTNPSESTIVELTDGRAMLNIRHESAPHYRAVSFSNDGATNWSKPELNKALPEPICMASLVRPDDLLLFSNPHSTGGRDRRNVSIHVSKDGGSSWPFRRAIESEHSGYSDLAVGDGWIYCLFERYGLEAGAMRPRTLVLAKFNRDWMLKKPTRIVCLGDSITKGYRPGVGETQAFPSLLESNLRAAGVDVDVLNVGIGGETTAAALRRLAAAVIAQEPDLVTIMYGANDSYIDQGKSSPRVSLADYRQNLNTMIRDLTAAKIMPVLMTTNRYGDKHPPDGSGKHPNLMMDEYMKVCRRVAWETRTPLIDHQQLWIDASQTGVDIEKWMTDHVHPNAAGHAEISKQMLPTIKRLIP